MDAESRQSGGCVQYVSTDPESDRLVRARKRRHCTVLGCQNYIEPGDQYLDVEPPMRQNGYFAQCIPCAVKRGLVVPQSGRS